MRNQNTSHSTFSASVKWMVVLVFALVCSVGFAQEKQTTSTQDVATTSPASSSVSESLNFMSWFMGTKQNIQPGSTQDLKGSSKKQLINSGITPNRLLLKTFMKKAAVYNNALA